MDKILPKRPKEIMMDSNAPIVVIAFKQPNGKKKHIFFIFYRYFFEIKSNRIYIIKFY